jgi:hypothetical protein
VLSGLKLITDRDFARRNNAHTLEKLGATFLWQHLEQRRSDLRCVVYCTFRQSNPGSGKRNAPNPPVLTIYGPFNKASSLESSQHLREGAVPYPDELGKTACGHRPIEMKDQHALKFRDREVSFLGESILDSAVPKPQANYF